MKVGDKVQYCGHGILGACGVIIREKKKTAYYSELMHDGDRYVDCYLVRYTLSNGSTVDNIARPQDLILLEKEK